MEVKIKKLCENATIPSKAHQSDAGFDLVATSREFDKYGCVVYGTGLAFEIPEGHVGLVFPRSSNAKKDLILTNSVGVVDSGYRGEVMLKFQPSWKRGGMKPTWELYEIGERVGQLVIIPYPEIRFVESEYLSESDRGSCGYGSTGK